MTMTNRGLIMEKSLLYEAFSHLNSNFVDGDSYRVEPISNQHKIGCSAEGFPLLFVKCSDEEFLNNIILDKLEVRFNQECTLRTGELVEKCTYNIVILKTTNADLIRCFLDVFSIVLEKLSELPSVYELKSEVNKLAELFLLPSAELSLASIQGLWAELFVIEQSQNPVYLIKSWHISASDKFDFNDGVDKIEVKSTSRDTRIHNFSIEQLNPNEDAKLVIASIFTIRTGIGVSVIDLVDRITNKLIHNDEAIYLLKGMVIKTIGDNWERIKDVYFDYNQAVDSYCFYDYRVIPSIPLTVIPENVLHVHFQSDLTNVATVDKAELTGNLHKCL